MLNYSIKTSSEKVIHFSPGELYLVQTKNEIDSKDMFSSNAALYLNYSFDEAQKIIPFFENIRITDQRRIVASIQEVYGCKIRVDDLFGKLVVVLFFNLELYDLIIVGLVGLGDNSIDALVEIGRKIISGKKSKTIILTKASSNLNDIVSVSVLSNG